MRWHATNRRPRHLLGPSRGWLVLFGLVATFVVTFLGTALWSFTAHAAFSPPRLDGHVVDTAGVLTPPQVASLDQKLDRFRQSSGFAIVVFVPRSLEGESPEDVAYTTFNTWKIGSAKGDDGVLLLIAPNEHQMRIETGKGVGGALTDLQSSHINRDVIAPRLKQGNYFAAIDEGTDAIASALTTGTPGGVSTPGQGPQTRTVSPEEKRADVLFTVVKVGLGIGFLLLMIFSPGFRRFVFYALIFGGRGGGGRGGGGFGGGGGSGYGGGGGSSGGGGSTDSW